MSAKTIDDYFCDWESEAFGFGHGTGEAVTLPALRAFLAAVGKKEIPHGYDCEALERAVSPTVAWLLINILCAEGILDYGISPRYGWLSPQGKKLKAFVCSKSADELYELVMSKDENYMRCGKKYCNCGQDVYDETARCPNPFWDEKKGRRPT